MVFSKSLSFLFLPALAFLSSSARASPHPRTASRTATLKLAVRINSNGIKNIAAADRARVQALKQYYGVNSSVGVTSAGTSYTTDIGLGNPPTYYTLLVDTGSSNTWIGANQPYIKTSTSQDTGGTFGFSYADETQVSGEEYLDTVTLNSEMIIEQQSIGVADATSTATLSADLDGILGLGPVDLTRGTVNNTDTVPTVMNNLYSQGIIYSEVLGVFFSPASADNTTGELTFGTYDASKIMEDVSYTPITSVYPASRYWGVEQSISYGDTEILSETAGIVDTGATLILIATDAFDKYQSATGATLDDATGLLTISSEQYDNLSSLYFTIGSESYELTPNAQIWPRSLNTAINGTSDGIYLIVSDSGNRSGSGLDFTNGYCFLERFYSVYDTTNSQVGFATTEYTYATSN